MIIKEDNKKEYYWVKYIKNRIANNKNFLGFISGPTGSGKSWSGLSLCFMVDKTFNPDRIVTDMRMLMKLINSGKLKMGNAMLWDEAGVGMSAKDWQSLTNRLVNFLLQTFRHKRFVLICTSPYMDFVDASTRKLFHAEFTTMSIDYNAKKVRLKPQLIQYNPRFKKFYYKYLRILTKNRGVCPITEWAIPKPPEWIVEEYERKKIEFTTKLNLDIERQLDAIEKKQPEQKPLTIMQQKVIALMKKYNDVPTVAKALGQGERSIYFHLARIRQKHYEISQNRGENE